MNLEDKLQAKIKQRETDFKTASGIVDEWAESLKTDDGKQLSTGMPSFDADLRGRLRGKVGAYIGYGGTKKSLLALQSMVTATKLDRRGLYSTMEMPASQLLERMMDQTMEITDKPYKQASLEYDQAYRELGDSVLEVLKNGLEEVFGDRFVITQRNRMTVDDYRAFIIQYEKDYGKLDILVVDGLSMMGGKGMETEVYTTNSGELKDLAKEFNIYVALICHLSKGATKHTRDTQRFIRGSEKILDNVDFVIMMSLLEDEYNGGYLQNKGFVSLYNKRGTGNTINKIYNFDENKLLMIESDEEPEIYEVQHTKKEW